MTKVVYNACFGGFGLSEAGAMRYAEISGFRLYPEADRFGLKTYWRVPDDERTGILEDAAFMRAPTEERIASNKRYVELTFTPRNIERDDPVLVQVVEELGDAANDRHAKLRIAEVPTGGRYRIDEYDGNESVETPETYDWKTA